VEDLVRGLGGEGREEEVDEIGVVGGMASASVICSKKMILKVM